MPTLLRTAAQDNCYLQWVTDLLKLSVECAENDLLEEACRFFDLATHYLAETLQPSRSWATGINRVVIWSLDNMYSEEECWERLRFHKCQLPELLLELELSTSLEADGVWRARENGGASQYRYQPMELLVIFLARLASHGTWSSLTRFLGGRGRAAYVKGFYIVLNHIYERFRHRINNITRWANHADRFSRAIRDEGAYPLVFTFEAAHAADASHDAGHRAARDSCHRM